MDDVPLVHGGERLGDVPAHPRGLLDVEGAVPEPFGERRPLDQLHHEVHLLGPVVAVHGPGVVQRDQAGVAERGQHADLGAVAQQVVGPVQDRGEDLDGHVPLEQHVVRAVHGGHAAAPEDPVQPVAVAQQRALVRLGRARGGLADMVQHENRR